MNANTPTSNAIATIDGFDIAAQDMTASPIRGVNIKFKDGDYYSFADQIDVDDREFVVLDRREGWQFLKKDCPPEYLMRAPGEPRPPQPYVDRADWPKNLNGVPDHPWKLTYYLYLLDRDTGEISTFWTNTVGGRIAIGALNDQVVFMRQMRPGAHPVVQLRSKPMPTSAPPTLLRPARATTPRTLRPWCCASLTPSMTRSRQYGRPACRCRSRSSRPPPMRTGRSSRTTTPSSSRSRPAFWCRAMVGPQYR